MRCDRQVYTVVFAEAMICTEPACVLHRSLSRAWNE